MRYACLSPIDAELSMSTRRSTFPNGTGGAVDPGPVPVLPGPVPVLPGPVPVLPGPVPVLPGPVPVLPGPVPPESGFSLRTSTVCPPQPGTAAKPPEQSNTSTVGTKGDRVMRGESRELDRSAHEDRERPTIGGSLATRDRIDSSVSRSALLVAPPLVPVRPAGNLPCSPHPSTRARSVPHVAAPRLPLTEPASETLDDAGLVLAARGGGPAGRRAPLPAPRAVRTGVARSPPREPR